MIRADQSRRLIFIILLFAGLTGCSLAADVTPPPGYQAPEAQVPVAEGPSAPLTLPDPSQGEPLYADKCAPCHGERGLGDGSQASQLPNPVPAIGSAEVARQAVPAEWYTIISQGNLERFMPGFAGSLSESQRWDVLAYVYSLSTPAEEVDAGKTVFQTECVACHGQQGEGDGPRAASLSNPPANLRDTQQAVSRSQAFIQQTILTGRPPDMPSFDGILSEDEAWSAAAYVRSLTIGAPNRDAVVAIAPTATNDVSTAGTLTPQLTPEEGAAATTATLEPAQLTGSVSGKVTHGSEGEIPSDVTVTLHGYDEMSEVFTLETSVDAQGEYHFDEVDMPAGRVFMATIEYGGLVFNSDVAHSPQGGEDLSLPLTIYDTTSNPTGLVANRMHVFFDFPSEGVVQVVELYILTNPTKQVIVPAEDGTPAVTFNLPAGAQNLQFQDGVLGERYVQTENGFGDLEGIFPGPSEHQVLFAFDLPYDRKLDLSLPVSLPVEAGIVMVPVSGIELSSDQLVDAGQRTVQDLNFQMYSAANLPAGSTLDMTLRGNPNAGGTPALLDTSDTTGLVLGAGVLGLALVLAGVWLYRSRQKPALVEAEGSQSAILEPDQEDSESLMDAIIALDDQFRSGNIPEEAYRSRRSELKSRLQKATQA